ncbi:putative ABC transport system permease protein [Agreia bicolorata]|uniref:Putative ABC transport system permease protein n=1 Tax=Agreia bicolorata TaxID=110935 RepID=A0A1T4WR42_9MICO|nr:ABC transporter permease [Agreia bicolorata]SKA79729.1 putative ABC transport system permease protein [Agreia bicolorata]
MNPLDLVIAALRSLRGNLTRSILTTLMVTIGVGSVITLVAVGNGTTEQVNKQVASLGASAVFVSPAGDNYGSKSASFTRADRDALASDPLGSAIDLVAPVVDGTSKAVAGSASASPQVVGTTPDYFSITNARLSAGRFFTTTDELTDQSVAVIDATLQTALFPDGSSAVGRTILVENIPLLVVGVLAPTAVDSMYGSMGGVGTFYAPLDLVEATLTGYHELGSIALSATSPAQVDTAKSQAAAIFAARGEATPSFYSSDQLRETLGGTQESLSSLLSSIAAISLLVGGIGVTNVMLLTVRERIREIGVRKALGAGPISLASQFVLEATGLSVIGGALGVAVAGFATLFPINGVMPIVDGATVALAAGLSIAIGVFFGTYPAVKAARMNPVAALRVGV